MNLKWQIKRFNELSSLELYQILLLRSDVFIVEQNCVYNDVDGKDQVALHLFATTGDDVVAYARLFDAGFYFEAASIGRVVVHQKYRSQNFGHQLMQRAITAIADQFQTSAITISAQAYLEKFYEQHKFETHGESYLEDGIPHLRMQRI